MLVCRFDATGGHTRSHSQSLRGFLRVSSALQHRFIRVSRAHKTTKKRSWRLHCGRRCKRRVQTRTGAGAGWRSIRGSRDNKWSSSSSSSSRNNYNNTNNNNNCEECRWLPPKGDLPSLASRNQGWCTIVRDVPR